MSAACVSTRRRQWPFWLLLAGWLCAQSPQVATYALFTWLDHARSFSHQHRLKAEVAFLLGGEARPDAVAHAGVNREAPPPPPCPADAVLQKIVLGLERTGEFVAAPAATAPLYPCDPFRPAARREAPPHEPPRAA